MRAVVSEPIGAGDAQCTCVSIVAMNDFGIGSMLKKGRKEKKKAQQKMKQKQRSAQLPDLGPQLHRYRPLCAPSRSVVCVVETRTSRTWREIEKKRKKKEKKRNKETKRPQR